MPDILYFQYFQICQDDNYNECDVKTNEYDFGPRWTQTFVHVIDDTVVMKNSPTGILCNS